MTTPLPAHVQELLEKRVNSFEKLEVVAALFRAPRCALSLAALATAAQLPRQLTSQTVADLRGSTLVQVSAEEVRLLLLLTEGDRTAIEDLMRLYDTDRFILITNLADLAMRRIRNMARSTFADAFVLRKKPPGGSDG